MPSIRQLPPSLVNKIAAGEVIERPASVVKELVENALDAGASRIDVLVEQGGLELIRVSDNGHGIAADELLLAVASHAAGELREADDLFRVATLGFRGEALASIAEVSRLTLRSRIAEAEAGAQIDVAGGHPAEISPCGCPQGTTVEVRSLFYNTPVRRKFLRSTQTESGHVGEAVTRLALAYPQVHFTLRQPNRTIYDLPPADDCRARIAAFFGPELAADLIDVDSREGDVRLWGYVAQPSHSRANARMQYLFLNGRAIRDRALQHALGEAYRGLLMTGRSPIGFLHFEMPPQLVDVNVHPTKLEVRFQDAGRLYSQLLGTLRTRFLTTDLTARLQPAAEREAAVAHDPQRAEAMRRELVEWAKGALSQQGAMTTGPAAGLAEADVAPSANPAVPPDRSQLQFSHSVPQAGLSSHVLDRAHVPVAQWATGDAAPTTPGAATAPAQPTPDGTLPWTARAAAPALQLHDRYLVAETEDGMIIIDQHALHERILYEQIRAKTLDGALESQSLLVPEPVDLSPAEAAAVLESRDVLARLGVTVEPFGGDTVLISSYPAMLANLDPAALLRDLVEQLLKGTRQPQRRDLVDELLHMVACKAAIKAGDRLAPEEIDALLARRHLAQDAHHCPHGRPTALVFTREELDRQFKRT